MAITLASSRLIAKIMRDKGLSGKCLTLGVQGVEGQYQDLEKVLRAERYNYTKVKKEDRRIDDVTQYGPSIHQDVLFKMLGFDRIDSLDVFPNENPTFVMDITKPVQQELRGQYDMVVDAGTLEHCLDPKEVLSNILRLLKVGGRVLHISPISGWLDHGFYQISPILFFDVYGENGLQDMEAKISVSHSGNMAYYFDYQPKQALPSDFGGMNGLVFFTARKVNEISSIKAPLQSFWVDKYQKGVEPSVKVNPTNERLKKSLEKHPDLYDMAHSIYSGYNRFRLRKKWKRLK